VAIRILKIVEPVQDLIKDYSGPVLRPMEGTLLRRFSLRNTEPVVTTRSLNTRRLKATTTLPLDLS